MQTTKTSASSSASPQPSAARAQPAGGRALSSMAAALARGLTRIDAALFRTLDAAYGERRRAGACLEAALLVRLRRGLSPYLREAATGAKGAERADRIDGVLADGLLEAVDAAHAVVADLEGEPAQRLGRWLSFCRELVSELVALGEADVATEKRIVELMQQRLKDPGKAGEAMATELGSFFVALCARLEKVSPSVAPSLLDEVLRNARPAATKPGSR